MEKSIKFQFFFPFAIIVCVQILLIWVLGFSYITHTLQERNDKEFSNAVNALKSDAQQSMEEANYFTRNLENNSFVRKMASDHYEENWFDIINYQETFESSIGLNSRIDNSIIIFGNKEIVLSNFSLAENLHHFTNYSFQIAGSSDKANQLMDTANTSVFIENVTCGSKTGDAIVMVYPYMNFDKNNKIITITYIDNMIKRVLNNFSHNTVLVLESNDGTSFYQTDPEDNLLTQNDWYNYAKTIKYDMDSYNIDSTQYYAMKIDLGYDITASIFSEHSFDIHSIQRIQIIMICILLACLALGLAVVYRVSLTKSKPLSHIYTLLQNESFGGNIKNRSELVEIEKQIGSLVVKERELTKSVQQSGVLLKDYYLKKLLCEQIDDYEQLEKGLEICNIEFLYANYCVYLIRAIDWDKTKGLLYETASHYNIGLDEVFISNDQFCGVIINFDEESCLNQLLNELLQKTAQEDIFNIGALGSTKNRLADLHESYEEALIAIGEKTLRGSNQIVRYDATKDKSTVSYYFPKESENIFVNFLKSGLYEKASEVLAGIIHENIDVNHAGIETLKMLYVHVMVSAFRSLQKEDHQLSKKFSIQRILSSMNHDDVIVLLDEMMKEICEANLEQKQVIGKKDLIERVTNYIDENFLNASLDLENVAAFFAIHRVYLSSMFNREMSCGFVEYVNRKRIEYSKIFLSKPDYKIADIYGQCGFNSEVTYRREFKKYNGVTPSQYRENILKN